jgi:hypothetical protein
MLTDFLAGLALLVFGVALSRMNQLLKRTQHRQIARLWQERGPRRISGGSGPGSASVAPDLRSHVRLWLAKGLLPAPGDTWAGPGTGKLCAVCALVISAADIEYQIGYGSGRLYAHEPCYGVWLEESATVKPWGTGRASPGSPPARGGAPSRRAPSR